MLEGREHYNHLVNEICVDKNYLSHGYYSQVYNYGDEYVVKKLSMADRDGALFWLMYCMYAHATGNGCRVMPRVKEFFWDENKVAYAVVERLRPIPYERFHNIRETIRTTGLDAAVNSSQLAAVGVSTRHIVSAQDNSDGSQFVRHVLILAALSGVGFSPDMHGDNLMYRGGQVVYNDPITLNRGDSAREEAQELFAMLKRLCPTTAHSTTNWDREQAKQVFHTGGAPASTSRNASARRCTGGGLFMPIMDYHSAVPNPGTPLRCRSAHEHRPHPRAWGGNQNFENLQQRHIKGVQHGIRR